ncbi:MAG TPA: universal stress protein [Nitrososphaeraceae archaeon]
MVLSLFKDAEKTRIFILEVIEWTDDKEEFLNGEMTSKVEEEALRMLSAVIYTKKGIFQRIVKICDPSSKIVDLAKKLEIDLITMGSTLIGGSNHDLGHVTRKVLKMTSKPVV